MLAIKNQGSLRKQIYFCVHRIINVFRSDVKNVLNGHLFITNYTSYAIYSTGPKVIQRLNTVKRNLGCQMDKPVSQKGNYLAKT